VVHIEPRIYGSERLRPDLDIIFPDQTLMMDVAITHPAAPSRHSSTPLAAATVTENAKISKYAKLAATHASSFHPFVLESYGAYGTRTEQVMKLLSKAAADSAYLLPCGLSAFLGYARKTLSVALQKGNALVGRRGAIDSRAASAANT